MLTKGIPIGEEYQFNCTLCGECCRGDMEVYLNPYDLFKLARHLGFSHTRQLFEEGYVILVRGQNDMPVPRIRFRKAIIRFCPFLTNELDDENQLIGRCGLHPAGKPLICSLSPVSRMIDLPAGHTEYRLVEPAPECPGMITGKQNRLSDLLRTFNTELSFETRFYRILDQLKILKADVFSDADQLYYFESDQPFETILTHIEKHYGILT